ncbi:MFS transporter [Bacillus sp. MUM 116]|uniref:MFS transporter n=1 Tax=Bacillus sp. MUM 116 TaxID=1678002 RepID=UPI0008F5B430|nr:MFS transporter [Bacillus sp. MUM 116]OIK10795.1 MFS transporter [Bacillus sp. MUM 116]
MNVNEQTFKIDDAPLNRFHLKITALTFGANFSDGYALGIIGMAIALLSPAMKLSSVWEGLIGSSALIGIFLGCLVLGRLSDRIGRQKIFQLNFLVITIASLLQFFVNDPVTLFILRLLIGFALGGDFVVGTTLLAEFAPRKYRGFLLASLNVIWTVGYVASNLVGYYMAKTGPESWRWMLVSAAIPAFIVLVLRIGTPESPGWLVSVGRIEEARRIVKKYLGQDVDINIDNAISHQSKEITGFKHLFSRNLWKRTAFGGLFYACQVLPYYAIYTFLPVILEYMGFTETFLVDMLLNLFLLVGTIAGLWCIQKFSRRGFTIYTFAIMSVTLFILSITNTNSHFLIMTAFIIFTFIMAAAGNLTMVYPAELFPTEVRASGIGVVSAISRIGSAIGTFLLPITLHSYGLGTTMLGMTAVLLLGTVISIAWAPETKSLSLNGESDPNLDVASSINAEGKSAEVG